MKRRYLLLSAWLLIGLSGCAASPTTPPHVLSGHASPDAIIERGDAAAIAGDYRTAGLLYRQAISQEPTARTWYRLGMAESHLDEPERAMWAFQQALALDPENRDSLQRVALYYTANGRVADATPYLDQLLAIDSANWQVHNAFGVLADLEQRFDDAAAHYTRAIELHKGSALLWNNLAYSLYLDGDYALATTYFEHALQLDSSYAIARNNLALVYARQVRYEEALKVMAAAGDEAVAYAEIGYLAFRMGHYSRAEWFLTEAIRRSPTYNSQAYRSLAAVREAMQADSG
jgi:Flp pilus assembly protein TadD